MIYITLQGSEPWREYGTPESGSTQRMTQGGSVPSAVLLSLSFRSEGQREAPHAPQADGHGPAMCLGLDRKRKSGSGGLWMGFNFFEIMDKEHFILGHSFPDEEGGFAVKAVISLRKFNS